MMALNSFGSLVHDHVLGSPEHFLAAYMGAGVFASSVSHLFSHLLINLNPSRIMKGSVGASGAIWGLLVMFAMFSPDSQAGIIFVPGLQFKMSELIPALALLDLVGLVRGWQMFDHAGHLGGAIAGYLYWRLGREAWSKFQKKLDEDRLKKK